MELISHFEGEWRVGVAEPRHQRENSSGKRMSRSRNLLSHLKIQSHFNPTPMPPIPESLVQPLHGRVQVWAPQPYRRNWGLKKYHFSFAHKFYQTFPPWVKPIVQFHTSKTFNFLDLLPFLRWKHSLTVTSVGLAQIMESQWKGFRLLLNARCGTTGCVGGRSRQQDLMTL